MSNNKPIFCCFKNANYSRNEYIFDHQTNTYQAKAQYLLLRSLVLDVWFSRLFVRESHFSAGEIIRIESCAFCALAHKSRHATASRYWLRYYSGEAVSISLLHKYTCLLHGVKCECVFLHSKRTQQTHRLHWQTLWAAARLCATAQTAEENTSRGTLVPLRMCVHCITLALKACCSQTALTASRSRTFSSQGWYTNLAKLAKLAKLAEQI